MQTLFQKDSMSSGDEDDENVDVTGALSTVAPPVLTPAFNDAMDQDENPF